MVSQSGHAAAPEEIIESCEALQAHIQKTHDDAEQTVKDWEQSLQDQELAEKRRVAPGWLDRDEKILEPERKSASRTSTPVNMSSTKNLMDHQDEGPEVDGKKNTLSNPAGDELDRAFGGMDIRNG